jgi:hypothetical protein
LGGDRLSLAVDTATGRRITGLVTTGHTPAPAASAVLARRVVHLAA